MSYKSKAWEAKNPKRVRTDLRTRIVNEVTMQPFSVVRKIDLKKTIGLSSLLGNALTICHSRGQLRTVGASKILLRGATDLDPAILLIQKAEVTRAARVKGCISEFDFIKQLVSTNSTADSVLTPLPKACGIFGNKGQHLVTFGLTFTDQFNNQLGSERSDGLGILFPEDEKPQRVSYPHLSIGKVALTNRSDAYDLKYALSGVLTELEPIVFNQVRPSSDYSSHIISDK